MSWSAGAALRAWYEPRRRKYPWRSNEPDPYLVLVSEFMLHQTQAARVARAFPVFVRRFPSVAALAGAPRAEVIRAWSGLGYNKRAVYLSDTARRITQEHQGCVPATPEILRRLPGVGSYTAAAVASIAFGVPVPALDTNVARVVARWKLGLEPNEVPRKELEATAARSMDRKEPGIWNQAVMDLGREACRPIPRCDECPLARACAYRAKGRTRSHRPRRQPPFSGSLRQVRGAIIRSLADRRSASFGRLCRDTGESPERVAQAVRDLARDGLVEASPAALRGLPRGRVHLFC